jgi:hypothetical protein
MYAAFALAFVLGLSPMVDATTAWEEEANPLTLGPSTITDRQGNLIFTDETDPAEAIFGGQTEYIGVGAGSPAQTFATSGVYNADFQLPPPRPSDLLDDANALPYWRLVTGADPSITYQHIDAAASPSGKAIRATITGGVVDDEAMFEQIIPVSPRQRLKLPILRSTVGADADTGAEVRIQYFKVDGSSTGSESSGALDPTFQDPQDVFALAGIPDDARFARIRFGVVLTGSVASDTVDFYEVWAGVPHVSYETWTFSDVSVPGTGTGAIAAVNTTASGSPATPADRHVAAVNGNTVVGWIEAISVILSTDRTAGTLTFQMHALGGSSFGPTASIDGTDTQVAYATTTDVSAANLLTPFSTWAVEVIGTGFTPTTADAFVTARVAFINLSTSAGGHS